MAPPEINYGEDTCVACGMIISDARFAAATIVGDESDTEPLVFDDVGDMLTYHAEHPELSVRRWYVHDYESLGWIGGANATFVRADPDDLPTPMMSGIAAFEDGDAARALAREVDGETLSFEAIFELAQRDALPGHDE